jgi:hypothetical protein
MPLYSDLYVFDKQKLQESNLLQAFRIVFQGRCGKTTLFDNQVYLVNTVDKETRTSYEGLRELLYAQEYQEVVKKMLTTEEYASLSIKSKQELDNIIFNKFKHCIAASASF